MILGFTLTNGHAVGTGLNDSLGGGAFCDPGATLSNCILTGNSGNAAGGGAYGGMLLNCELIGNRAYNGGGAFGCTLLDCTLSENWAKIGGGANTSTLSKCTLADNEAEYYGAGSYRCTMYNCLVVSNRTTANGGGGVYGATLYNCVLRNNTSAGPGAGAADSTLFSCTLVGNSAGNMGGGAYYSALFNCIAYYNVAPDGSNYYEGTLDYCCAEPLAPVHGNIASSPLFADILNGNFRLQSNSPCLNAGTNQPWMTGVNDLDGNPRINNVFVDIGAYELQISTSAIPVQWLWANNLAADGSVDYYDSDEDGMNNWEEWRCRTQPTNDESFLKILNIAVQEGGTNLVIQWASETSVWYRLQRSTNLQYGFIEDIVSNIPGDWPMGIFTDTTSFITSGTRFYRAGVE